MSTFDGFVEEFPDIRIDYFRSQPDRRPPLKCFLSHVHSDHLQGLESLKSPFVYCSPATREIVLRLEKYPHRMNLAKGILEARKQHYKHLKKILKPLPLNTPSEIELSPGRTIKVTLLDANHCAGAVMFLIEGDGKAILYTGDIRSEPWWVETLARNPVVIPYTHGIRHLDKIYLDTTFAPERHDIPAFPTKAEGLEELLKKVAKYPLETTFHFNAWTFGYEEVWIALANALNSQIHVDEYKLRLYQSLRVTADGQTRNDTRGSAGGSLTKVHDIYLASEAAALCGHRCGNNDNPGYLTNNQYVRLHSCEAGTGCKALDSPDVVRITPIITHSADGSDVLELGAGGGGGDLTQHELELDDEATAKEFLRLLLDTIKDISTREETERIFSKALLSPMQKISLDSLSSAFSDQDLSLKDLARILTDAIRSKSGRQKGERNHEFKRTLPRQIRFPYSRHSSYDELCHLVRVFEPKDVYPCTVDEKRWTHDLSVRSQFGHLCSEQIFAHDSAMIALEPQRQQLKDAPKRVGPSENSPNELRTSSQASENSQVDEGSRPAHVSSWSSPTGHSAKSERSISNNTTPCVKRRRTNKTAGDHQRSPHTVTTASTNTFSLDGRLRGIRHSFHDHGHSNETSEKPRSLEHSTSDPTPLLWTTPKSKTTSADETKLQGPQMGKPIVQSSAQWVQPNLQLPREGGSKHVAENKPSVTRGDVPEGTQARPIDLSDTSDKDIDSDATTDGEGIAPTDRIKTMDGADDSEVEENTQITLSDAAFESQEQIWQDDSKLRSRKEAYRAAKGLAKSGWETDFVIVSSKSADDNYEVEL